MYVTRRLLEILFHCVLARVVLCMHHQMHLCRQCIFYLVWLGAVWVPVLLPLLSGKAVWLCGGSAQILLVVK